MPLAPNTRFDHYEIRSPLGAGGMGEVYRARDTRLNREVALKVLPASFAQDADRLRRFEQEARATSSLNHPNILTVHDFGIHEGNPYLVMELLEGEELRAQLNHGALPVRRCLEYAQQIVAGLTAAHDKGVIHRDLKPENLFVTKDGRVKILDFGLAKMELPTNVSVGSDVATLKQLTTPGTVMGTVAYMSPEQVRGETVDHRSDLFAFGQILYEMLMGKRAFDGATIPDLMSAILKDEPPELSAAQNHPQLEKIVRRCLEKKPERRFQTASDLGFALDALSTPTSSGANRTEAVQALTPAAKRSGFDCPAWIAAGVLGLIALTMTVLYFNRSASSARAVRLAFAPPENLTFDNGRDDYVIVSPDGQKLVFTGRSADGRTQLWVRTLDQVEATPLSGTDDPYTPFWSPDSRSIGLVSQGKLKRIDLADGRLQTLCDAPRLYGGSWNRDGVIIFTPDFPSSVFQIPATGGEPLPVTNRREGGSHTSPYFLPDGRHFLYRDSVAGAVFVGSLDSKEVKQLMPDAASTVYVPHGWLLFERNESLMAQAFDAAQLELKGDPIPLIRPTDNDGGGGRVSVSENGVLVWQHNRPRESPLIWFDRAGKQGDIVAPLTSRETRDSPQLSPDGRQVVTARSTPQTQNRDIWVIDLQRNLPTRLTTDPGSDQNPIWSPDGRQVAFQGQRRGVGNFYQKAVSGTGAEEFLGKVAGVPLHWSADGRFIFFSVTADKTRRDIWVLPLFGDRQPWPLINSAFDEYRAQFSPDGRWLAYVSDEGGGYEIYVQPFTPDGKLGGSKQRISTSGGNQPRFRRDGQELFYVAADGQMMAVAVKPNSATFEFAPPKALFKTQMPRNLIQSGIQYDVTADGQRFLISTQVGEPSPVSVILNWTEGLKK